MSILERISEFDFIKESLKGKNTPFNCFGIECDEGWSDLIYNLCKELDLIKFDGTVVQIKEKFGGLRFYINGGTTEVHNLIDKAESDSFSICEVCGKPGTCINYHGWLMTKCEEHKKK